MIVSAAPARAHTLAAMDLRANARANKREANAMHVGVAGLGRMGAAMAARLAEVGYQVSGWNRSAGKAQPLASAGVTIVQTPAELAASADTVITSLTDAAPIDAGYRGPDGLLPGPA